MNRNDRAKRYENKKCRRFGPPLPFAHFRWFVILLLVGLMMDARCLYAGGVTHVNILDKVDVRGRIIRLMDIAEISGDDVEGVETLGQIAIAKAPPPGEIRQIRTDSIKTRLKRKGFPLSSIVFTGAGRVDVLIEYQQIDTDEIEQSVRDFIQNRLLDETGTATIKGVTIPKCSKLPLGRLTYEPVLPENSRLKRKVPVHVDLHIDGEWVKKMVVVVELEIVKEVVAARRTVNRGRMVDEDDLFLKTMDVSDLSSNVITDMADVLGKRTKKKIDALKVFRTDMVEYPPLVTKGDIVQVIVESENLRISTVGMIKGVGGRRGDRVRVVNLESNKSLHARVIDAKTVSVDHFK